MLQKKRRRFLAVAFIAVSSLFAATTALANQSTRIVGGTSTTIQKWPFVVSLQQAAEPHPYWGHFCGGSLLRARWVLTAAHCVENLSARDIDIVARRSNLYRTDGQRIAAARIFKYSGDGARLADMALIYLQAAASAPTVPLAASRPADGSLASFAGWGVSATAFPSQLQNGSAPIVGDSTCQAVYGSDVFSGAWQICAGLPEGGVDTCQGDSGGPLIVRGRLVGVTSLGFGCAQPGVPGVYGKVSSALAWIGETIQTAPSFTRRNPSKESTRLPQAFVDASGFASSNGGNSQTFRHSLSVSSNYHFDDLRASLTGGKNNFCVAGTGCVKPGQWFRPRLSLGHRNGEIEINSTLQNCIKVNYWARIRERGKPVFSGASTICASTKKPKRNL